MLPTTCQKAIAFSLCQLGLKNNTKMQGCMYLSIIPWVSQSLRSLKMYKLRSCAPVQICICISLKDANFGKYTYKNTCTHSSDLHGEVQTCDHSRQNCLLLLEKYIGRWFCLLDLLSQILLPFEPAKFWIILLAAGKSLWVYTRAELDPLAGFQFITLMSR